MTAAEWIALGSLWFFSTAAIIGALVKAALWLSGRFTAMEKAQTAALAAHEEKDQDRHDIVMERLDTLGAPRGRARIRHLDR